MHVCMCQTASEHTESMSYSAACKVVKSVYLHLLVLLSTELCLPKMLPQTLTRETTAASCLFSFLHTTWYIMSW